MCARRLNSGRAGLAGLVLLLSACAGFRQPPLWQPAEWPASSYRVDWPSADGAVSLWVAIEAGADGLGLVVLSPEGMKMLTARYRAGQLDQQLNPLRPAGLSAAALLEAWQLAFGPGTVASVYGTDCAFADLTEAERVLRCGGESRATLHYRNGAVQISLGEGPAQYWVPLEPGKAIDDAGAGDEQ